MDPIFAINYTNHKTKIIEYYNIFNNYFEPSLLFLMAKAAFAPIGQKT